MKHRFLLTFLSAALLLAAAVSVEAARPVARWDVVPNQRITGVFKAGVCAFHENGVRVKFEVAGKTYTASDPGFNDRTGVWEYFVPIDAGKLPDGPLTVKARAETLDGGECFDLPELTLFADTGRTQGSHAETTIGPEDSLGDAIARVGEGGTVYLKKGVYKPQGLGGKSARKFWTTLTPAPGVKRDEVEFGDGRPGLDKLHFKDVTFALEQEGGKYSCILAGEGGSTRCWIDGCKMYNKKGRWASNSNMFGNGMIGYVTGGETTEMCNGPSGPLLRGHTVYKITSDVWTGSDRLVVNCKCWDVNPGKTGAHPDFYQSHAKAPSFVHDVILYNVSGYDLRCQGLFGVRIRDSAFVNVSMEVKIGMYSQFSDEMTNVLFAHVTDIDQSWLWREATQGKGDYAPTDVRFFNSVLRSMGGPAYLNNGDGTAGLKVANNAFYGTDKKGRPTGEYGSSTVHIPRTFVREDKHEFALPAGSPALKAGIPLQCVPADINGVPYPSGPRPCGAFAK